ncbi:hypothetical protein T439DRAFT_332535 [Meredithblackwellia eburnea MCA 4105]
MQSDRGQGSAENNLLSRLSSWVEQILHIPSWPLTKLASKCQEIRIVTWRQGHTGLQRFPTCEGVRVPQRLKRSEKRIVFIDDSLRKKNSEADLEGRRMTDQEMENFLEICEPEMSLVEKDVPFVEEMEHLLSAFSNLSDVTLDYHRIVTAVRKIPNKVLFTFSLLNFVRWTKAIDYELALYAASREPHAMQYRNAPLTETIKKIQERLEEWKGKSFTPKYDAFIRQAKKLESAKKITNILIKLVTELLNSSKEATTPFVPLARNDTNANCQTRTRDEQLCQELENHLTNALQLWGKFTKTGSVLSPVPSEMSFESRMKWEASVEEANRLKEQLRTILVNQDPQPSPEDLQKTCHKLCVESEDLVAEINTRSVDLI